MIPDKSFHYSALKSFVEYQQKKKFFTKVPLLNQKKLLKKMHLKKAPQVRAFGYCQAKILPNSKLFLEEGRFANANIIVFSLLELLFAFI